MYLKIDYVCNISDTCMYVVNWQDNEKKNFIPMHTFYLISPPCNFNGFKFGTF